MNLKNVQLILAREVRDQLRDRRTLFMIFVLPILLYPLLGMAYFQMVQFQTRKAMNVLVVGSGQLAAAPAPFLEDAGFAPDLFADGARGAGLLTLSMAQAGEFCGEEGEAAANRTVENKEYDAALVFPPDFARRLEVYRKALGETAARPNPQAPRPRGSPVGTTAELPRPKIIYTTANERSVMACNRLTAVLDRWTDEIGRTNLAAGGMPAQAARPFEVDSSNLAGESASKSANIWSRLLPIMLLLWALTGAFHPAVDLCAGEKERGTLETLLSSPAERSEIVLGKLLTVMAFSMITAALNLVSVGITGCLIFRQVENFGGPPWLSLVWLPLALVPVSAIFRALPGPGRLRRSTKEGQYYLMPLLMLALPLAVLPMSPGVELNLGNSLVPVAGLMLLMKTLLEGSYLQAFQYMPIVLSVTLAACWLFRPLGGAAIQPGIGDLPRVRAVFAGALAAADRSRPRADTLGCGGFLPPQSSWC